MPPRKRQTAAVAKRRGAAQKKATAAQGDGTGQAAQARSEL